MTTESRATRRAAGSLLRSGTRPPVIGVDDFGFEYDVMSHRPARPEFSAHLSAVDFNLDLSAFLSGTCSAGIPETIVGFDQDTVAPIYVDGNAVTVAAELGLHNEALERLAHQMIDAYQWAGHSGAWPELSDVRIYVRGSSVAGAGSLASNYFCLMSPAGAAPIGADPRQAPSFEQLVSSLAEELPAVAVAASETPQATDNPALDLHRWSGLAVAELASLTDVSERSFYEWLKGGAVSEAHKLSLIRLRAVVAILVSMLTPEEVAEWLRRPTREYEGRSPADLWKDGREQAVIELVGRYLDSVAT